jgi:PAS domain S-box-containing protein
MRSLRVKAILWALLPTLLVLSVVAITSIYVYGQVAQDIVRQRDTELAKVSALRLSERLDQHAKALQSIAASPAVQSLEPSRVELALEQAVAQPLVFDAGMAVYDIRGVVVSSHFNQGTVQGTDFLDSTRLNQVKQTLHPVFSDIFPGADSGKDLISLAVPILGSGGEFKGVLVGMANLETSPVREAVTQVLEFRAGRSGAAYLVDGNGRVIHHRVPAQLGRDFSDMVPVSRAINGATGAIFTEDLSGDRVIAAYSPVPNTSWGLVTQEKWSDVVGPIQAWGKLLLVLLMAGGAIAAILIFWAFGRILTPIKELTQGAERIASGDFGHTIVAETGDEIQALAHQFNSMAHALHESYTDLEQRVEDRTGELRRSQEAERQLAEENALVTRIGHIISSTLDINEVYEQFSQEVKNLIGFDRMNLCVVNQAQGTYTIKYLSGLAQPGRHAGDVVSWEGSQTKEVVESAQTAIVQDVSANLRFPAEPALLEMGLRSRIMVPLISRGNVIGTMTLHSSQVSTYGQREKAILERLAGYIAPAVENAQLYEDAVREKERATNTLAELEAFDEALKASEERYRTLFEQSRDAIVITRDGRVVNANQSALDLFGYTREQALGLDVGEVYFNIEDRGPIRAELEKRGSVKDFELHLRKKDGTGIYCLMTATLRNVEDGNSYETQGILRDITEHKRAEEALRQSEERYRSLFEQSRDAIVITRDGIVVDANQSMLELFSCTREEALGSEAVEAYADADDRGKFIEELLKHGSVKDFEIRMVKKDGTEMDCLMTAALHKLPEGNSSEIQGIIRDITQRKGAEEALRQSEERLRRAQQAGRLGTWDWEVGTNELIWDGVEPIHGLEPGAFDNSFDTYLKDVHPDDRETVAQAISQAAQQATDLSMEYRIIWPDQSLHWVQGTGRAFKDEAGRTIRMTGTCQDITQRKMAEEALRQSEERYRRLVEQAVDSFCITDREGSILDVNQQACESLGYSREELLGMSIPDLCPESNLPMSEDQWEEWTRRPAPVTLEKTLQRKDGTIFPVEIRAGLIDLNGRTLMFALARDVTERKEAAETQIQQARELAVLGERNRMAREIHDTLAQGFTGIILQMEAAEQALEENPLELSGHLDRAKRLARNSLQEARRSVWNLLPHALEQLPLESALREEVKKFDAETSASASFQLQGNQRELASEAQTALLRICQESLNNVKKHANATDVTVQLTFNSDDVCLNIRDNGRGFNLAELNGVTEQSGFGLSGMDQRARLLGGSLKVKSNQGQGTLIEARIPIK